MSIKELLPCFSCTKVGEKGCKYVQCSPCITTGNKSSVCSPDHDRQHCLEANDALFRGCVEYRPKEWDT